jgi:hypothetical protein
MSCFPVSSLGHTVPVPSWIGGSWATMVRQESTDPAAHRRNHSGQGDVPREVTASRVERIAGWNRTRIDGLHGAGFGAVRSVQPQPRQDRRTNGHQMGRSIPVE